MGERQDERHHCYDRHGTMLLSRLARARVLRLPIRVCGACVRLAHTLPETELLDVAAGAAPPSLAEGAALAASAAAPSSWVELYTPVGLVQSALLAAHESSGLPWWATIAAGTVLMRAALLPAVLYQTRQQARFAQLRPLLRAVGESCQHIESRPRRQAAALAGMWRVSVQHGVHPLSLFAGALVQLPVFVVCIVSVRRLLAQAQQPAADAAAAGLETGGALWFVDLTAADPFVVLPLLTLGSFLATTELAAAARATGAAGAPRAAGAPTPPASPMSLVLEYVRKRFQDVGLIAAPAIASLPVGVFCYWLPNNLISLAQGAVLRSDWAKAHGLLAPFLAPPPPTALQPVAAGGGLRASARAVKLAQAAALEARGEAQAAAETYRGLVREEPAEPDAALALVRLLLASASAEAHAMAVAVLRPLVAMKPGERRAALALVAALERAGEPLAEGEAALRALLAATPADAQARIAYASLLARPRAPSDAPGVDASAQPAAETRAHLAAAELARAAEDARAAGDESAALWCEREAARLGAQGER
jgi:YidC/Oxa1 family membrane protein insertase